MNRFLISFIELILDQFLPGFIKRLGLDRFYKNSGGWVDGWVGVKAVLRIAYRNQKTWINLTKNLEVFFKVRHIRNVHNFAKPIFVI